MEMNFFGDPQVGSWDGWDIPSFLIPGIISTRAFVAEEDLMLRREMISKMEYEDMHGTKDKKGDGEDDVNE